MSPFCLFPSRRQAAKTQPPIPFRNNKPLSQAPFGLGQGFFTWEACQAPLPWEKAGSAGCRATSHRALTPRFPTRLGGLDSGMESPSSFSRNRLRSTPLE